MSFVVQVWAQPAATPLPRDGFEADAQRLQLRQSGELGPLEFLSLIRSLQERFPPQDDDPLWIESFQHLNTREPVLDIGLHPDSPRFDAAINFAAAQANALGLHLADSVSGIVHLADGSVIGEADEVLVFAAPDAPRPPAVAPHRSIWDQEEKIAVYPDLPDLDDEPVSLLPAAAATLEAIPELTAVVEAPRPAVGAARLRHEAESGDPHAAYELGLSLQAPAQGEPDPAQAVYWFERGAEAGDAQAAGMLGACLLEGQGTARDTVRARHWLERAVNTAGGAANSTAQFQLGRMLVAGWGGPAEPERGVRLYIQASAQGHADAMFNLASCLDAGYGCEPDRVAAKALFLRARALGSPLRAAGLRVKQREIETVRTLARRFEVSADIPALIEERRVEKALVRALARKPQGESGRSKRERATKPRSPRTTRYTSEFTSHLNSQHADTPRPVSAGSGLHLGHLALIFSGIGMPLVLLLMSGADLLALTGTLAALALLGVWGAWRIASAWRPTHRGALAALAAVPGLGLLIGAALLLRFGRRLSWPSVNPSQTRQG